MAAQHHTLDIYGTHLHAAYTNRDWNQLRREHPGAYLDKANTLGLGATYDGRDPNDQHHQWIWVGLNNHHGNPAELIDTCAHEATHAALNITHRHAFNPTAGNGEPLAYLVGWLTTWLHKGTQ